jgi:MFS family permease
VNIEQQSIASAEQADGPDYSARVRWTFVAILFCLSIVSVIDRHMLTLLVVPIQTRFGLSDVQMSVMIGLAFALPNGLFSIPIGWAVDRYSRRAIIAAGLAVWSLATAATGFARSFTALVAARATVGFGEASIFPSQGSILGDLFPREKLAFATSIASMGFKAGQGMALLIGGLITFYILPAELMTVPLLGQVQGWQAIFLLIGMGGLMFVPLIFCVPEPLRRSASGSAGSEEPTFRAYFAFIRANPRFYLCHHLGFLAFVSMAVAVSTWTPAYLIRHFGWSESMTGAWLGAAILIAPILGMPIHGAIVDWLYRRGWHDIHIRYPMVSAAIGAPIAMLAFSVGDPRLAVLLVGVYLFIISNYASLPLTAVIALLPSRLRGKAVAIVMLCCGAGGSILGPLIAGTINDLLYGDPKMIGNAVIWSLALLAPLIFALFYATLKPLRAMR